MNFYNCQIIYFQHIFYGGFNESNSLCKFLQLLNNMLPTYIYGGFNESNLITWMLFII